MINIELQFFGGRGGGGSGGARGGRASSGASKVSSDLRSAMQESPGMREYAMTQVLEAAPMGTKIYDGSTTVTERSGRWQNETTYYEKTSHYGWTLFGDINNYDSKSANRVAKDLNKKSQNPNFNLRVTS